MEGIRNFATNAREKTSSIYTKIVETKDTFMNKNEQNITNIRTAFTDIFKNIGEDLETGYNNNFKEGVDATVEKLPEPVHKFGRFISYLFGMFKRAIVNSWKSNLLISIWIAFGALLIYFGVFYKKNVPRAGLQ